jgi:hypothetical protein
MENVRVKFTAYVDINDKEENSVEWLESIEKIGADITDVIRNSYDAGVSFDKINIPLYRVTNTTRDWTTIWGNNNEYKPVQMFEETVGVVFNINKDEVDYEIK